MSISVAPNGLVWRYTTLNGAKIAPRKGPEGLIVTGWRPKEPHGDGGVDVCGVWSRAVVRIDCGR